MINIAVLISGSGTNLESIIDSIESRKVDAKIALVLSNEPDAYGLVRAEKHNIPTAVINHRGYKMREDFDKALIDLLEGYDVDLICLAGFMRLLTPVFLRKYPKRVINIHPAILPSFAGSHGQEDAFEYGVKFSGCTIHFVDEGVDTGPIIIQAVVPVMQGDTIDTLKDRILAQEHKIYPQAIQYFAEGRIEVKGKKVVIKDLKAEEDFAHINPSADIFDK